ncbi:hypothetical protein Q9L58_001510 [Maublancomyces gigas]|uniref:F-box domain-containing protein n=1 Tax=Discina gigas TaxID=1032678 RepID=A0ABR3GU77_9PEZI
MPPFLAPYPDNRWTAKIMAEYHNSFPLAPPAHLPYWTVFCPHIPPSWCFLCSTSLSAHLPASVFRSPFISLPPDIHLNIFTHLTTLHDLSSLTATCHHFRILLQCYPTTILRALLSELIPAFPSALLSIRATQLTAPKPADWFASLTAAPATLPELTTICRLSALTANWQSLWQTSDVVSTPEIAAECFSLPHALERFNHGCYMALALGVFFPLTDYPDATLTAGFFSWLLDDASNGVVKKVAWVDDDGYEDATRGVSVFDVGEMRELLLLLNCAEMLPLFLNLADTFVGRPMPRAMLFPDGELTSCDERQR